MYTKQEIILRNHREGLSKREISKELGISRITVSKYIKQYKLLLQEGINRKRWPKNHHQFLSSGLC